MLIWRAFDYNILVKYGEFSPSSTQCDTNSLLLIQIKCSKCQDEKPTRLLSILRGNRFVYEETIKVGWLVVDKTTFHWRPICTKVIRQEKLFFNVVLSLNVIRFVLKKQDQSSEAAWIYYSPTVRTMLCNVLFFPN